MKRIVTLGAEVHMAYQTSLGFVIGCHIGCSLGSPVVAVDEQISISSNMGVSARSCINSQHREEQIFRHIMHYVSYLTAEDMIDPSRRSWQRTSPLCWATCHPRRIAGPFCSSPRSNWRLRNSSRKGDNHPSRRPSTLRSRWNHCRLHTSRN